MNTSAMGLVRDSLFLLVRTAGYRLDACRSDVNSCLDDRCTNFHGCSNHRDRSVRDSDHRTASA